MTIPCPYTTVTLYRSQNGRISMMSSFTVTLHQQCYKNGIFTLTVMELGPGMGSIDSNILCRNVQTGPTWNPRPGPIATGPLFPILSVPFPVLCNKAIIRHRDGEVLMESRNRFRTQPLARPMAHTYYTGPVQGQGPGNDGFLYYTMYCTHCTGTGTWNHCFLLCPSRSLSLSLSRS